MVKLVNDTCLLLNRGIRRSRMILKAPTGSGKTVTTAAYMARLVDELRIRPDVTTKEVAFVWIAPNQLHLQSLASLSQFYGELRTIRPVQFGDLAASKRLMPNDLLFLNWESINKESNRFRKENEQGNQLVTYIRQTYLHDVEVIVIMDEYHLFGHRGEKAQSLLQELSAAIELGVTATPPDDEPYTTIMEREQVVVAQMIKKGVMLNPDIRATAQDADELDVYLLKEALRKRDEIRQTYLAQGIDINPLLLIQLPSDTKSLSAEDRSKKELTIANLDALGITTTNKRLAIWLSDSADKINQDDATIKPYNSPVDVLLFKQAIAQGWDCPRAAVLLIYRQLGRFEFSVQTVGRILRMPQHRHYNDTRLDFGYVYTDLAKDMIQVVKEDADYFVEHRADRRADYANVLLQSAFIQTRIVRNRLNSKFRKALFQTAEAGWELSLTLGSAGEPPYGRNADALHKQGIETDVTKIDIPIPADIELDAWQEAVTLVDTVHTQRFARQTSELTVLFRRFCYDNCGAYAKADSYAILELALKELFEEYLQYDEFKAVKVMLYGQNTPHFVALIEQALALFAQMQAAQANAASQKKREYVWEVPPFRLYNERYAVLPGTNQHILQPTYLLNNPKGYLGASGAEHRFVLFLEANSSHIQWWYKNGDGGEEHFAVPYLTATGGEKLFYVDFIILFANGVLGLFDTKTSGSDPVSAPAKHNALLGLVDDRTVKGLPTVGGVLVPKQTGGVENWRFCRNRILDTTNLMGWDTLFPATIQP